MKLSLIVAASTNNVIGKDNQLLWSLPNDMRFFKNTTWAMPVLMGRKTFESLGKPLPGRLNIVITRQQHWQSAGATVVHSLEEALKAASDAGYNEAFVIGGGEIFVDALSIADQVYLTRVDAVLEGDAFFPALDETKWKMVSNRSYTPDAKHKYAYHFQLWQKANA